MLTGYVAPPGLLPELLRELKFRSCSGADVKVFGDLVWGEAVMPAPVWVQNIWLEPKLVTIKSISDAAKILRSEQRNWWPLIHDFRGRVNLIQAQLPALRPKPLAPFAPLPSAPMGAYTLLADDQLCFSARTTSVFPGGEVQFQEDRTGPPSRAYLKLWEVLTLLGVRPQAGELCLDLGSSPGGWTWALHQMGARVLSIDKAPLAPDVAALSGVTWQKESAFALSTQVGAEAKWWFSDVICYPTRLLGLIERWLQDCGHLNFVATIKFQGPCDFALLAKFRALAGARVLHLFHNKHELTFVSLARDRH